MRVIAVFYCFIHCFLKNRLLLQKTSTQKKMGLFRILLFAILLWYGIKYLTGLLFPSSKNTRSQCNRKKEGEVTIQHDRERQERFQQKKKEGEYIDYEEIK